jgi:ferredoxin-type protein NapH
MSVTIFFMVVTSMVLQERGSTSVTMEAIFSCNASFCPLVIPMMLVPAAITKTIIFPGSILPTATNSYAIGTQFALWAGATIILGRAWCSWGCFFGGLNEAFSLCSRKPFVCKIDQRWRLLAWAVLVVVISVAAISLLPFYCNWLCPFNAVTEFQEVNSLRKRK